MSLESCQCRLHLALAVQRLTEWSLQLIDIEYVMSKQFTELDQTLLKIRIMKCGVRLCGQLSVLTEEISDQWMISDYQSKLLDLYDDPCLAPSVKLLIIRILDQTLFFKSGLIWFTGQHPEFPLTTRPSPYFRLLEKLQMGTEVRFLRGRERCLIVFLHISWNKSSLCSVVSWEKSICTRNFSRLKSKSKGPLFCRMMRGLIDLRSSLSSDESPSWTSEQAESRRRIFDDLVQSLSTVRDVLINATDLISQEKTSRLASCQSILSVVYAKLPNNENPWPCVLRWLVDTDFLKSLTVLIHLCILNHRQDLFNLIEDILREFFHSSDALVFLANQIATPNGLLKALYYAVSQSRDERLSIPLILFSGDEIRRHDEWSRRSPTDLCISNVDADRRTEVSRAQRRTWTGSERSSPSVTLPSFVDFVSSLHQKTLE